MNKLKLLLAAFFAIYCIQVSFSQEDEEEETEEEQNDKSSEVKCSIDISYSYIITYNSTRKGFTSTVVTENTHKLIGKCTGVWKGENFSIGKGATLDKLSGSAIAKSDRITVTTNDCANVTEKHSTSANLDLKKTGFTFRYEKRKDDDLSSFDFWPDGEVKTSGNGQSIKVCGSCVSCKGGTTPYTSEQVSFIAASSAQYSTYGIGSEAGKGAQMMQMMGQDATKLLVGKIEKTGEKSFSITQNVSFTETKGGDITNTIRKVTITIAPDEGPKYEAFIEPVELLNKYDEFIPFGPAITDNTIPEIYNHNSNNKEWGNSLMFEVKVYEKASESEYLKKSQVTWTLADVSKYPGFCNNYPPRGEEDSKPDLRFIKELNAENQLLSITDLSAVSKIDEEQHMIVVTSFDYASYGKLQADVKLEDGTVVQAKYKPNDGTSVTIPKDEDMNRIADKWEKQTGIEKKDANWDEDFMPILQRRNGDGYTLFEEYRGFKAQGHALKDAARTIEKHMHFRGDPKYKDVFIYDEGDLFKTYYAAVNPADLNWHYIKTKEMVFTGKGFDPENRWVNFHKTEYHYGKQYAMYLAKRDKISSESGLVGIANFNPNIKNNENNAAPGFLMDLYFGLTETKGYSEKNSACSSNPFEKPLKCFFIVEIFQGTIETLCKKLNTQVQQEVFQKMISSTVIHEVGHGLGITHHRKGGAEDPIEVSRGVPDCSMRYNSDIENGRPSEMFEYQKRYCRGNETFFELVIEPKPEEDKPPLPVGRNSFPAHNCYSQIDVKTDP